MSFAAKSQLAPPAHKGLKQLNRSLFDSHHSLVALRIPAKASAKAMETLRGSGILSFPRTKAIVDDPTETGTPKTRRLLLLGPEIQASSVDALPEKIRLFANEFNAELTSHQLKLGYDHWTSDQILRSILPDEMEVPGAFETIGHIAHLNLRDQHEPYKQVIGQVILDKCRNIKTVVNKTDKIDHTFRFFQMEVLAGEDNMVAEVNESNCTFRFDFSKVYWNSRLQGEHERIVKQFQPGDLICDVFAGVGPFALPAAKNRKCIVFANDLNPQSYKYLVENTKLNKLENRIRPYNLDGRQFIRQASIDLNDADIWNSLVSARKTSGSGKRKSSISKEGKEGKETKDAAKDAKTGDAAKQSSKPQQGKSDPPKHEQQPQQFQTTVGGIRVFRHFVMNLPATAIEFLDAFHGLYSGQRDIIPDDQLPMIHCHCFSRSDDQQADVMQRVERVLGASIKGCDVQIFNVRNVAPKKDMMCISFRLPASVAFSETLPSVLGKRKSFDADHEQQSGSSAEKKASPQQESR
ncbi:guanine(37)-N1-methyltransferase [Entophlyctis helioformis]|nr:guanine(37)-N1-methyltransferase [Entophlyctis helioformis]